MSLNFCQECLQINSLNWSNEKEVLDEDATCCNLEGNSNLLGTSWNNAKKPMHINVEFLPRYIGVEKDRLTVSHKGRGSHLEVGTVQSDMPIPTNCQVYYFEVLIIESQNQAKCTVGIAARYYWTNREPGADKASIGYRGEDGKKIVNGNRYESFGPSFGKGDIIGCGIDFNANSVFFTLNGRFIGIATDVLDCVDYYPTISLYHSQDIVYANFGSKNFAFHLEEYIMKNLMIDLNIISQVKVDSGTLRELIRGYLLVEGFQRTLKIFDETSKATITDELSEKKSDIKSEKLSINQTNNIYYSELLNLSLIQEYYEENNDSSQLQMEILGSLFSEKLEKSGNEEQRICKGTRGNYLVRRNTEELCNIQHKPNISANKIKSEDFGFLIDVHLEVSLKIRSSIRNYILNGDIKSALDLIENFYPEILDKNEPMTASIILHIQSAIEEFAEDLNRDLKTFDKDLSVLLYLQNFLGDMNFREMFDKQNIINRSNYNLCCIEKMIDECCFLFASTDIIDEDFLLKTRKRCLKVIMQAMFYLILRDVYNGNIPRQLAINKKFSGVIENKLNFCEGSWKPCPWSPIETLVRYIVATRLDIKNKNYGRGIAPNPTLLCFATPKMVKDHIFNEEFQIL
ncbi:SPRY domain-containing protein [Cryptosporidium muris RN66]|uniref:SPRY domain-containing protein n=1 Tax=Cryptosporidium muris (strain RN66) TaxID=441375 RepID=B6ABG0_CRYMR|nr:SPRY domain-containing protein [Cryptosporidium muris RN66]EEA05712.1 SPRY domain-containing protein [Cryptosporidium muris RN66]|eukprot:XP_002140061.1 SPRY domain-containing protein [Cryptosporidium muris RN66]